MSRMMSDLVEVQGGFKPSVQLPDDFFSEDLNRHFVESYIPTRQTLDIFMGLRESLQPNSGARARLISGTYGTGKSDLMLMIANYMTRSPDDPLLIPFFKRLRNLDNAQAEAIQQARLGKPPFLIVLLQADSASTFSSFVLDGLSRSLERVGLGHLLESTFYQAALDLLGSWERDWPDNIRRLEEVLEMDHGRTLNQLKHDLAGPHADSALATFRPAVLKVTGMQFHPTTVIERPAEAFLSVTKQITTAGQYSGVFLIADEFTHLLQKLAESLTAADSKAIDNLAEAAARSGSSQLHFYAVSLESFASVQGTSKQAQIALERSGGRFIPIELLSLDTEELISSSIAKLIPSSHLFNGLQAQTDDLLDLAIRLWTKSASGSRSQQWLQEVVVQGCFPLHPLTTYCLPRLNAVLAQNERTMFSFIWDRERGLSQFIQKGSGDPNPNGRLSLLSLDRVFPYFEANLKEKRPDLLLAYQQAGSTLSHQQLEEGLEGRLVRALVLLDVAGGDPNLRADREILRQALGLAASQAPDIEHALHELEQAGIAYPTQSGFYQLVKPGHANPLELRREINRRVQSLSGSPIELLNAQHKPNDLDAVRYNNERGTVRKLTAIFVSCADLVSPAILRQALQKNEGLLCYVVAGSEPELQQAHSAALQLTRQHDQLIVAAPRRPTDLVQRFLQKRALEALRASQEYQSSEYQDLLRDTGLVGSDYATYLEESLRFYEQPSNFTWFRDGHTEPVATPNDRIILASTVMGTVFPDTPAHSTRQHLKPSGKYKPLQEAIDKILQAPFTVSVGSKARKTPADAILLNGAEELGLLNCTSQEKGLATYDVCMPSQEQKLSSKVWSQLDKHLQQGQPWSDLVSALMSRPYGLYPSVLQLFWAAFYRANSDYLEVYRLEAGNPTPLIITSDRIIDMVDTPTTYAVYYRPLTEQQRKFLRGLVERAIRPNRGFSNPAEEGTSLRGYVANQLRNWARKVPSAVRQASLEEIGSILQGVSTDILSACVALIQTAFQASEAQMISALSDTLPVSLGLSSESIQWTESQVDQALAYAESACQELQRFQKTFELYMAWRVGQLFGLSERPNNPNDSLWVAQKWRKETVGMVHGIDLGGAPDARDLLKVLDNEPHDFEQAFLNTLAFSWKLKVFGEWAGISVRDEFLRRLEEAKHMVETKAIELHSSEPQVKPAEPLIVRIPNQPATSPGLIEQAPLPTIPSQVPNVRVDIPPSVIKEAPSPSFRPVQIASPDAENDETNLVRQAFAEIQAIMNRLSHKDQIALWNRLVEEYDPR